MASLSKERHAGESVPKSFTCEEHTLVHAMIRASPRSFSNQTNDLTLWDVSLHDDFMPAMRPLAICWEIAGVASSRIDSAIVTLEQFYPGASTT